MGFNVTTKQVQDVVTDLRRTFGDESAIQVTDSDIVRWVSEAQREILISNKILKSVASTDVVASQSEYSLDGLDIVTIQSIHFKGHKLQWRSFQEAEEYIMSNDPQKTLTQNPEMWYEWGGIVNLYPVPQYDEIAALKIYYIKEPPDVVIDGPLLVPDRYYHSILQFCLAQAYELDEDPENSSFKLDQFAERLNILSNEQNTPEVDTYSRITVLEFDL